MTFCERYFFWNKDLFRLNDSFDSLNRLLNGWNEAYSALLFCVLKLIRLWRKKRTRWNTSRLVGPPDRIWRLLSPKRHWRAPSYICSRPLESACWAPVQSSPQSWLFSIAASVSFSLFLSLLLYYLALLFLFNHTSGCRRRWRWDCLAFESEVSQAF